MAKPRIIEPEGVTGETTVESYDRMMRRLLKRGYLDTSKLINAGIASGLALEIGPGPGYLGIDWLTKTSNTFLKGQDISPDMLRAAQRNAQEFRVSDRAEYVLGDAKILQFQDGTFDAVFTNGSLHEWSDPIRVLNEIDRVIKPGGVYYLSDLRRDIDIFARILLQIAIPPERKKGFLSSLNASYTIVEIGPILKESRLAHAKIGKDLWTLVITGIKE